MILTFLVQPIRFQVTQWCQPIVTQTRRPGWYAKNMALFGCDICRFRPAHFPPLLSGSPTSVGGLQNILQIFTGLNPYFNIHVDMQEYTKVYTSC